ncbi:DNA/RNA non-specific endonuclease [Robiginitalea aurantiaca]|uniref:Endonuclease n=1 Tax=Robiginitalea aurantiaca TaxID=3056915 RepID=A0ABT7WFD5_9FLAO|nr:DNA/RNA non-specific endonuclease [Robiginitalea aurantiaca]MDM9631524.1 DNA/RNA non-specific endonuclease [Robiginitalea aurantiaca]
MAGSRISRKQWTYILLFWIVVVGFWWLEKQFPDDPYKSDSDRVETSVFPEDFLPYYQGGVQVLHDYYLLSYVEKYEQSAWVAYTLDKAHLTTDQRVRPYYVQDPEVPSGSAHWRNFKGSGYDRGHLCPAGDRRFSETAYNQTFYTSNISPQDSRFNAGIWNELEQQIRSWAKKYGRVYVITGGVLRNDLNTIGEEGVAVPEAFYKVVIRKAGDDIRVLGFLMSNADSDRQIQEFVIPLDELEALSGLDFFPEFSEGVQQSLEGDIALRYWDF